MGQLVGLLLAGVVVVCFGLGFRAGLIALLLIRPVCDRIFELGRFDVGGSALSPGAILNLVVIGAVLTKAPSVWRSVPPGLKSAWFPFLMVVMFSVTYAPVPVDAARKFLTFLTFAAMFFVSFMIAKSDRDRALFFKVLVLSSVLPLLYGLFQAGTGFDWYQQERIHSTFTHPNILAFYLVMVVALSCYMLCERPEKLDLSRRWRLFLQLYLVPLIVLLLLTKTRSAWVGCGVILLAYGIVRDRRALAALAVAPFVMLALPGVGERITGVFSNTDYIGVETGVNLNAYAWRQLLWENTLNFVKDSPIIGYGLESFVKYSPVFFPLEPRGTKAHNIYIMFYFEAGILGLMAFTWLMGRICLWIVQRWRVNQRLAIMAGATVVTFMAECYSDNIFDYVSYDWCFWFGFGLMLAPLAQARAVLSPSHSQGQRYPVQGGVMARSRAALR